MDPLRQLRYACTVPQITELDKSYQLVDKFLHTSELLKHLKRKNDENTKNELRTMLICLNSKFRMMFICITFDIDSLKFLQIWLTFILSRDRINWLWKNIWPC